ncbi:MAG: dihydroxy-acid dehydratase, partial [Roseovarius gahaiensis]
ILLPEDFAAVSSVTPLMAKVYPNGLADVNHFHAAAGLQYMIAQLLDAGLLQDDVKTVAGPGLSRYTQEPKLSQDTLDWTDGPDTSGNEKILRPASDPFKATGGLQDMAGNLGTGIMKVSAVAPDLHMIEAPARIFEDQEQVKAAFRAGEFTGDCIVVVRFQGPRANGMPELHGLTPILSVLLDRGLKIALVTDGRMSGASGKVPAALHVSPEAALGGPLARLQDGDILRVDARAGRLEVLTDGALDREAATPDLSANTHGTGRELFELFRQSAGLATLGASPLLPTEPQT